MAKSYKRFTPKDKLRIDTMFDQLYQMEDGVIQGADADILLKEIPISLKKLHKKYPLSSTLGELICTYIVSGGNAGEVILMLEKIKSSSRNADFYTITGQVYMREEFLFLAKEDLDYYCDHVEIEDQGEDFEEMYSLLCQECEEICNTKYKGYENPVPALVENDRGQLIIRYGNLQDGLKHYLRMVRKYPDFIPIQNNLGLCYLQLGQLPEAREQFEKVIDLDADNFYALGQLCRTLFYLDETNGFQEYLKKLEDLRRKGNAEIYSDLIYLHALQGNHDKILRFFSEIKNDCAPDKKSMVSASIYFYCGTACLMTDKRAEGTLELKKITGDENAYERLAQINLADGDLPQEEQNGPAYFTFHNLFPHSILNQLLSLTPETSEGKMKSILQKSLPLLSRMLPTALEWGDSIIRSWYVEMFGYMKFQEFRDPLYHFMQSKKASAELKKKLYTIFSENGDKAKVGFFKITTEPRNANYTPHQQELYRKAYDSLVQGKCKTAVKLWTDYIEKYPHDPSAINNLASTYENLNQHDKKDKQIARLEKEFPHYFFYRIQKASTYIVNDRFDEAQKLLEELLDQDEFHVSEFKALAIAFIELALGLENVEDALHWYDRLKEIFPDEEFGFSVYMEAFKALNSIKKKS